METKNELMSYDSQAYQRLAKICIDYRKKNGISQAELAKEIGITQTYLSCIENMKKDPSFSIIMKICQITSTSIKYIANGAMTSKDEQFYEHVKTMISKFDDQGKEFTMNVIRSVLVQYANVFEKEKILR